MAQMTELKRVLMQRDDLTERQADRLINDAKQRVIEGENPEDILRDEFGLEPDYFFDLC